MEILITIIEFIAECFVEIFAEHLAEKWNRRKNKRQFPFWCKVFGMISLSLALAIFGIAVIFLLKDTELFESSKQRYLCGCLWVLLQLGGAVYFIYRLYKQNKKD